MLWTGPLRVINIPVSQNTGLPEPHDTRYACVVDPCAGPQLPVLVPVRVFMLTSPKFTFIFGQD